MSFTTFQKQTMCRKKKIFIHMMAIWKQCAMFQSVMVDECFLTCNIRGDFGTNKVRLYFNINEEYILDANVFTNS